MLMDRIIGAFTFRRAVYAEVEKDTAFSTTAWILVVVVALINQLGAAASRNLTGWLFGAVVGTVFAVIGFALGAFVISLVGRAAFNADVSFDEMVRTLGLAYVWQVVGVIGIAAVLSPALAFLTAPAVFVAALLGLVAWLVATKEALDLEWLPTIVTVIIGWLVVAAIMVASGIVLGLLGLGAAGVGGLLG
ncbi:MAG: YIP1 family protein [Anaerolineae bacterium]